jgi:hypothetical protein
MKLVKILFLFLALVFLNGCLQSTALIGPGITMASTGNVVQAGLQYTANRTIKNETGKDAFVYVKDVVQQDQKSRKFNKKFKSIVENRIQKARKKMFVN